MSKSTLPVALRAMFVVGLATGSLSTGSLSTGPLAALGQESQWQSLFDGQSLAGWRAGENPNSWAVRDGAIVTQGDRSHLFYEGRVADHDFKNFEFSAEVMTTPGSNSGIYIHTQFQQRDFPAAGYELQVINSNPPGGGYQEHKMTGSIYAIRNTWQAPAADNQWFTFRILVSGKTIQTFINDKLICDYTEGENPWRPNDKRGRLLGSGTFALQAHDPGSVVSFRKLKVRLLPDDAPTLGEPLLNRDLDQLITQFSNDNLPLIDLGLVADSPQEAAALAASARKYGLTMGSQMHLDEVMRSGSSIVIISDGREAVSADLLAAARAAGAEIAFSSGGASAISEERLLARLQAIRAARLRTADFWIPSKN